MSQSIKLVPETENVRQENVAHRSLSMRDGQTLHLDIQRSPDGLTIAGESQPLRLTISMGETGPKVEISHASLTIKSTDRLELEAEHLSLKGNQSCSLATDGDVELRAAGAMKLESQDDCVVKANVIHLN